MSKSNPNQRPTPSKLVRPKAAEQAAEAKLPARINSDAMPLGPQNYKHIGIGIAILVVGFFLLSMDGFVDATQFSVSLHISPFVIIGGYTYLIWALMLRSNTQASETPSPEA